MLLAVCVLHLESHLLRVNQGSPNAISNGSTVDISPLLHFKFKERVYYKLDDSDFPSDLRKGVAWFVGISETVGHTMTYKLLTLDTKKIIR